jgi:hypothetical protein
VNLLWLAYLVTALLVGGSVAFGLAMYAARDGGRKFQAASNELFQQVARE